ncbi:AfsR/SARP family transcriptional regulator [Nonomuraea sp. MG754425]|uniref:BTAD domain-containing putative transcriptional regulator n=1 Tax=Nonomuraea sp. MG754425 TaxID=2570319 RepID=UPI001F0100C0|nr:BTAD domain-containing putative transcriptional regulator [Nonomuraea sp. MG754425]MCF6473270.1 AfsR/SARP family transcriptional regulator [Nonomuraea sp. MG754425]
MRFGVLGPLVVWTDAGETVTIPGLKVRALLVDLLVHEGHPVSVDRLVDDLWGAEPPANPAGALQVRVSQLRKAFEDAEPGGKNLVVSRAPGYLLRADEGGVDAVRFAELLARAEATDNPRTKAGLLGDALALWRGPAYADFADEEHTRSAVHRLEEQRLSALEQHAEARLELGEHGLLVGELGDLVNRHPLRERLRAVHMRALYRAGRQSEALASFGELRERLADELGLDPGPELVALHQAILGQDPALSVPAERPVTNLPASVSRLIGRDEALAEVCGLVEEERLVTLTGSGGVGKTRLALEAANRLLDGFTDGVWLVALDQGPRSPAEAVLASLDIREEAGGADATPAARLAAGLRSRRALLVLDNCEHVVEQVAELAEVLLRSCPGLRILATSREPLAVAGEVLWSVPPLDLPASADLAAMAGSDAVRLFVTRAAASARGFRLEAGNAQAVAQLCRRLDGIPLALELAATRVRALGVQGVVARLDDRFRLLATGQRGAPARQQTLTAVIDWSWDLLPEDERIMLRRLAVHADGCTLEAAESVCADGDPGGPDVLDLLARLVDRSLVVVVHAPTGVRYRLLESVSEYCVARMADAGELDRVRDAHLRHYLELAVRAEPGLYGPEQREWLLRLDAEAANLWAALDTAAARGDGRRAAELVNALAWYWFLRGRLAEGRRAMAQALAVAPSAADGPARARAAAWEAGFAVCTGGQPDWKPVLAAVEDPGERARAQLFVGLHLDDMPTGQELAERALATFREIGDRWGIATALTRQAMDAFTLRDKEAIERIAGESARLFTELGDRWGLLRATEWLASLAEMRHDIDEANRLFGEGLRMAEDLELWPEVATHTAWLGWVALESGEYGRAVELCERALKQADAQGYAKGMTMAEMGVAYAARRVGRLDLAERHLNHLLEGLSRDPDAEPALHLPDTLIELGWLTDLRGDPAAAMALHAEALTYGWRIGDPRTSIGAVVGAASAAGPTEQSALLLGLAAAARDSYRLRPGTAEREDVESVTTRAREALGEEAFAAAYARGGTYKLDDAQKLL